MKVRTVVFSGTLLLGTMMTLSVFASNEAVFKAGQKMKKTLNAVQGTPSETVETGAAPVKPAPAAQPAAAEKETDVSTTVTTDEMKKISESPQGTIIIDSRFGPSDDRFRIPGAISLKGKFSRADLTRTIPGLNSPIILYGENEGSQSSANLAAILKKFGYSNVRIYKGGIEEWKKAGNRVIRAK